MDNQKLSDRVMALEGPDREVDAEIYLALHKPDWRVGEPWKKTNGWFKPNCADDAMAFFFHDGMGRSHKVAPDFTRSLDAAMSLVPEGLRWCVDTCDGVPRSFVEPPHPYEGQPYWGNHVTTPAIALCAAALKARGL